MRRAALLIVLTMVFFEWLDFSLYLYLAKEVFATQFFPVSSDSLTLTFALFATAFLARPVGGWLFGCQADRNGRRKPMVFSAALMGFATLGICILPTYLQCGILATWGLLGLRVMQGLALGGEVNTSAMFLVEHHPHHPLMAGSLVAASGAFGMFMGGMLAALIQYSTAPWTWRVVFAIIGGISLWVCKLRKQLRESPEFTPQPLLANTALWKNYWRGLINIATIGAYVSVTVYICNAFWLSFAINKHLWSSITCTWAGSLAQLASALLALPIAHFAKPYWSSHLLQISMLIIAITAPALFYFSLHMSNLGVIISLVGYTLANGLICAALYYFLYQQLPAQYRCRGVSVTWALAASLGAICLPIIEQGVTAGHANWLPGVLVSVVAIICLTVIQINRTHAS